MPRLIARVATPDDICGLLEPGHHQESNLIELPAANTDEQLWRALGFAEVPNEHSQYPQFDVQGVYKRLSAGIRSVRCRGFADSDIIVSGSSLTWTSGGGAWSSRPWSVTSNVEWDEAAATVHCSRTTFEIGSASTRERTIFRGGPLDSILSRRLDYVFAIIGGRASKANSRLTQEERDSYHDLHPSACKAWADQFGRLVLEDDDYGRGFFDSEGNTDRLLSILRRVGWTTVQYQQH